MQGCWRRGCTERRGDQQDEVLDQQHGGRGADGLERGVHCQLQVRHSRVPPGIHLARAVHRFVHRISGGGTPHFPGSQLDAAGASLAPAPWTGLLQSCTRGSQSRRSPPAARGRPGAAQQSCPGPPGRCSAASACSPGSSPVQTASHSRLTSDRLHPLNDTDVCGCATRIALLN